MTCRTDHPSRPTLFVAIVALSAVALIGQALATPRTAEVATELVTTRSIAGTTAVATLAEPCTTLR